MKPGCPGVNTHGRTGSQASVRLEIAIVCFDMHILMHLHYTDIDASGHVKPINPSLTLSYIRRWRMYHAKAQKAKATFVGLQSVKKQGVCTDELKCSTCRRASCLMKITGQPIAGANDACGLAGANESLMIHIARRPKQLCGKHPLPERRTSRACRSNIIHGIAEVLVDGHELHRRLRAPAAALAGHVAHAVAALVGVQAQRAAPERRQVRVVRRRGDGHRPRAPAEQVAKPAGAQMHASRYGHGSCGLENNRTHVS